MRIYNYDVQRAEKSRQENDKKVASYNRMEKTFFIIKSAMLMVMATCVLAMAICVIAALIIEPEIASSPILWGMVVFTGISLCMTLAFVVTRKKAAYVETTYYDNLETRYHRLNSDYKIVKMTLDDTNTVSFLCEKDRCVEAFSLKPRLVKTTKNVNTPTLDVKYDCLWLPA